jgi:hypothetical protein
MKLGFGLAAIGLPIAAYFVPADGPPRSLAIGHGQKAVVAAAPPAESPIILPKAPVVMPIPPVMPPQAPTDDVALDPTDAELDQALRAMENFSFGQNGMAPTSLDSQNANRAPLIFGGIPFHADSTGGFTAELPAEAEQALKARWGKGQRPRPGVTVWSNPGSRNRYEFFVPRPNGFADSRGRLRVSPQMPLFETLTQSAPNAVQAAFGRNLEDVKREFNAVAENGDKSATVTSPPTEYSEEPTVTTFHSNCDGNVETMTIDLREDMQPGLAAKTRELLLEQLGDPISVEDQDGVVVTTYASSPPVVTHEFGGGEMVRIEIGRNNPAFAALFAEARGR